MMAHLSLAPARWVRRRLIAVLFSIMVAVSLAVVSPAATAPANAIIPIHITPAMWLLREAGQVKGARLHNKTLHVRTTVVGWRKGHIRRHHHRVAIRHARFMSVHLRNGKPYGVRVYFTQTAKGPRDVVSRYPGTRTMSVRMVNSMASTSWWNPISWHWKSIGHYINMHLTGACAKGAVDGYLAYNNILGATQLLAAGGYIADSTYLATANPDLLVVGVVTTCTWGIYRSY